MPELLCSRFLFVAAIAVGGEYPHAIIFLQIFHSGAKLQTQADQPKDHLVALSHGSHDEDDHWNNKKKKKAEIDGKQKAPTHAYEEGHIRHPQKHGWASAAAE